MTTLIKIFFTISLLYSMFFIGVVDLVSCTFYGCPPFGGPPQYYYGYEAIQYMFSKSIGSILLIASSFVPALAFLSIFINKLHKFKKLFIILVLINVVIIHSMLFIKVENQSGTIQIPTIPLDYLR